MFSQNSWRRLVTKLSIRHKLFHDTIKTTYPWQSYLQYYEDSLPWEQDCDIARFGERKHLPEEEQEHWELKVNHLGDWTNLNDPVVV